MSQFRNYIEDLTARVERAKKAGTPLEQLKKTALLSSSGATRAVGRRTAIPASTETSALVCPIALYGLRAASNVPEIAKPISHLVKKAF